MHTELDVTRTCVSAELRLASPVNVLCSSLSHVRYLLSACHRCIWGMACCVAHEKYMCIVAFITCVYTPKAVRDECLKSSMRQTQMIRQHMAALTVVGCRPKATFHYKLSLTSARLSALWWGIVLIRTPEDEFVFRAQSAASRWFTV